MTRSMIARVTPKAGQDDRLKNLVEEMTRNVRAEADNIRFEAFAEDGGDLVMLEEYEDDAAFEAHLSKPHTKQFNEALEKIALGGGAQVTELTAFDRKDAAKPGIRGIDHAGLTVPDVEAASRFFEEAFGAKAVYDVLPKDGGDMSGEGPEAELGLMPGTRIVHMRLLRLGNGPSLELFQMEDGEQKEAPRLQDLGLTHLALYVDDMDAAMEGMKRAGGSFLKGPHPLAGVEDNSGNAGIYGRTPWGMLIELLTYPGGIDYPNSATTIRWTPHT